MLNPALAAAARIPAVGSGRPKHPLAEHTPVRIFGCVKLIEIYRCLCDETRLRILQLLTVSPLCGCHLQSILEKPQVKISQHLSYLRERGLVITQRRRQWIIYSLPTERPPELHANLKCLQDCVQTEPIFAEDRAKLAALMNDPQCQLILAATSDGTACC